MFSCEHEYMKVNNLQIAWKDAGLAQNAVKSAVKPRKVVFICSLYSILWNDTSYLLSATTDNEIPLDSTLAEMYNNIS